MPDIIKSFVLTLVMVISLALTSQGQVTQRSEVGLGIGAFTYIGDLSRTYSFVNARPAVTLLYRLNISKVISLKTSFTGGMIGANDSDNDIDIFTNKRSASFSLFLLEGAVTFEYHFFNWRDKNKMIRLTPYLFAGVGLFGISGIESKSAEYSDVQLNIPFGGGIKYILTPHLYMAFEVGVRQTFFDYLDDIAGGVLSNKNYQYGDAYDYDSYFFVGLSINRTFYTVPCSNNPY